MVLCLYFPHQPIVEVSTFEKQCNFLYEFISGCLTRYHYNLCVTQGMQFYYGGHVPDIIELSGKFSIEQTLCAQFVSHTVMAWYTFCPHSAIHFKLNSLGLHLQTILRCTTEIYIHFLGLIFSPKLGRLNLA